MSIKAGARHNARDMGLLKELGRTAKQFNTLLVELGLDEDELEPEETSEEAEEAETEVEVEDTNPTTEVPVGTEVIEGDKAVDMTIKAVSLEERSENVRSQFYKTFRNSSAYMSDNPESFWITGVYDTYVVVKCGICYSKVSYSQGADSITFTPRDQWEKVETEWVSKSLDLDALSQSVKSVGEDRLGMYLVLWGNDEKRDIQKEWFTPETRDMLDVFKAVGKIPTMYHHGMDKDVKSEVVGIYDVMVPDDIGIWAETQLNASSKYKSAIKKLASLGALGSSSGAAPATRKVKASGEIERWTIMEGSLTPSPVEYRQATEIPVTVLKSIYSEIGLTFPYDEEPESPGVEETQKADDPHLELELSRMSLELAKMKMEVSL